MDLLLIRALSSNCFTHQTNWLCTVDLPLIKAVQSKSFTHQTDWLCTVDILLIRAVQGKIFIHWINWLCTVNLLLSTGLYRVKGSYIRQKTINYVQYTWCNDHWIEQKFLCLPFWLLLYFYRRNFLCQQKYRLVVHHFYSFVPIYYIQKFWCHSTVLMLCVCCQNQSMAAHVQCTRKVRVALWWGSKNPWVWNKIYFQTISAVLVSFHQHGATVRECHTYVSHPRVVYRSKFGDQVWVQPPRKWKDISSVQNQNARSNVSEWSCAGCGPGPSDPYRSGPRAVSTAKLNIAFLSFTMSVWWLWIFSVTRAKEASVKQNPKQKKTPWTSSKVAGLWDGGGEHCMGRGQWISSHFCRIPLACSLTILKRTNTHWQQEKQTFWVFRAAQTSLCTANCSLFKWKVAVLTRQKRCPHRQNCFEHPHRSGPPRQCLLRTQGRSSWLSQQNRCSSRRTTHIFLETPFPSGCCGSHSWLEFQRRGIIWSLSKSLCSQVRWKTEKGTHCNIFNASAAHPPVYVRKYSKRPHFEKVNPRSAPVRAESVFVLLWQFFESFKRSCWFVGYKNCN